MGFLAKLFGNKASRDNKALQPILDKTLKAYEEVEKLDIDALRHKTVEFKEYVKNYVADEEARIKELKLKAENDDLDLEKKNEIYEQVDKLEKHQLEKIEEALNNIMPEAFAVLKETARRFKENMVVVATATDLDRELASKYDHINIDGDKVSYNNSWIAGGNMITWDMVPYNVQIIGGAVLHQGKIAEMATGNAFVITSRTVL